MTTVDGGIIKRVIPFPTYKDSVVVFGTWSGSTWESLRGKYIQHFHDRSLIGFWSVIGIECVSGNSPGLILTPMKSHFVLVPNDILVFRSGYYTQFDVIASSIDSDILVPVEVGPQRDHGIAVITNNKLKNLILFHETPTSWKPGEELDVYWEDLKGKVTIINSTE